MKKKKEDKSWSWYNHTSGIRMFGNVMVKPGDTIRVEFYKKEKE